MTNNFKTDYECHDIFRRDKKNREGQNESDNGWIGWKLAKYIKDRKGKGERDGPFTKWVFLLINYPENQKLSKISEIPKSVTFWFLIIFDFIW